MTQKTKVSWVALTTDFYRSDKAIIIRSMPDGDSIMFLWTMLLALAGELNEGGALVKNGQPITLKILANFFQKKTKFLEKSFEIFTQFDMIFCENSTYYIVNWNKYQHVNSLDKIRENDKIRSQKYRSKVQKASRDESRDGHVTNHAGVVLEPYTTNTYTDITDTEDKLDKLDKYTFVSNPVGATAPSLPNVKLTPLERYMSNLIKYKWIEPDDLRFHDYEELLAELIKNSSAKEVGIRLSYFLQQKGLKFAYETDGVIPEDVRSIGDRFSYFKSSMTRMKLSNQPIPDSHINKPPTTIPTDEEIARVLELQRQRINQN